MGRCAEGALRALAESEVTDHREAVRSMVEWPESGGPVDWPSRASLVSHNKER